MRNATTRKILLGCWRPSVLACEPTSGDRVMRDRELLIKFRVGIFVLVLLLLFVAFVLTIGIQTRVFEAQYPLQAAFRDVQGLVVGAPVRLAGLSVGTVRPVRLWPAVAGR